jgi:hypothetical protein
MTNNDNKEKIDSKVNDYNKTEGQVARETWTGKFDFFLSALGYAGKWLLMLTLYPLHTRISHYSILRSLFFTFQNEPITSQKKFNLILFLI